MATSTPTSLLGTCPSFKGKRKSAKEFMTNIELYFNMNEQRISTNQLKILLALQHISEDAQQWKENEKTDLDDSTNGDKQWNDWTGFKTRFLKNWEELDSPGNAFSELLKQTKVHNRKKMIIHNQVYRTIQRIDQESRHHRWKRYLPVQSRPYHRRIQEYCLD
jgi:hypothetical protein